MSKTTSEINDREFREYHAKSYGIFFSSNRLLYEEESEFQKIEVFENPDFGRVLVLDGLVQTTEMDEFYYHEMIVHPALVVHPDPVSILIVGGGDGGTLREVLRYPVKTVKLVEIDPRVVDIAKEYFGWLASDLMDDRSELIIQDGWKFIQETSLTFDVILIDSSEPVGPSCVLHTREFFEAVKGKMKDGGIVISQLGSPFFHGESIEKEYDLLKSVFKQACLFTGPVPTYPGGTWCYGFLSEIHAPEDRRRDPPPGLRFYSPAVHKAAFLQPHLFRFIR